MRPVLLTVIALSGCHQRSDCAPFVGARSSGPEAVAELAHEFIIYPICVCTAGR